MLKQQLVIFGGELLMPEEFECLDKQSQSACLLRYVERREYEALKAILGARYGYNYVEIWSDGQVIPRYLHIRRTLLRVAANAGYESIVQLLLARSAGVAGSGGELALQEAAANGHQSIVRMLLDSGANANTPVIEFGGKTAFQTAIEGGYDSIVKTLLESGADINIFDKKLALQTAIRDGHESIVKLLLENKAEVKAMLAARFNDKTALQVAAENGHELIVKILLANGADINAVNNTTLQIAAKRGHESIVKLLRQLSNFTHNTILEVFWEGLEFYQQCNGALGDVLTITRTHPKRHCYIAKLVSAFLDEYYPSFGQQLLTWITTLCEKIQKERNAISKQPDRPRYSETKSIKQSNLDFANPDILQLDLGEELGIFITALEWSNQRLELTISATSDNSLMKVKSALTWITSTFQPRKGQATGLFKAGCTNTNESIGPPNMAQFSPTPSDSYCWTNLFKYACIAELPLDITPTGDTEGLEIDFNSLLSLADVDREVTTGDDLMLFGFDTALVPLDSAASKRWHFLCTDGIQITPARLRRKIEGQEIHLGGKRSYGYCEGNVYVGWCGNPMVNIGTETQIADPKFVADVFMSSGISEHKSLEERSERSSAKDLSTQGRIGFMGSALSFGGGMKREQKFKQVCVVAAHSKPKSFERMLDVACATPCILWDNSTQQATMLPAVSILLFASLCYIKSKEYAFKRQQNDQFETATFVFAQCSVNTKESALGCLRKNYALQVASADGQNIDEEIFFHQIVGDIWAKMSVGEDICSSSTTGKMHEKKEVLFGYDLKEAICGTKMQLRSMKITHSLKSWEPLARVKPVQVIFCRRVGPIISCASQTCSSAYYKQPLVKGVLSCLLQDLKRLYGERWDSSPRLPIGDGFEWIPQGPEIFHHSDDSSDGSCGCCPNLDCLQSIRRTPRNDNTASTMQNDSGEGPWLERIAALRFGFKSQSQPQRRRLEKRQR
ncbi:MAG: hypothetical protein M1834_004653 [Cirrosporium novae-zelandiae]|nr:MAG: hypothetical protein M1834_004653 [Cirrosporium novae-zelandiae]